MTKDMLPERLRNIPGLEMFDPNAKQKPKIMISDSNMNVLEKVLAPLLDKQESA